MPTTIHFLDGNALEVEEEPDEVRRTFDRDRERVLELSGRNGGTAYVVPNAIAYWQEARSSEAGLG